jgi:AAA family ATPase
VCVCVCVCVIPYLCDVRILQVRPSAMREVVVDVPRVLWTDIGGQEHVKQQLKFVFAFPLPASSVF